jgi:peroxiredoxin Q/BCP
MGMERNSFDRRDGRVLEAWRKVKVPGHASEVLEAARVTA